MSKRTILCVLCTFAGFMITPGCDRTGTRAQPQASKSQDDQSAQMEPVVVTHFTDTVQLFMEYPRLVRGEEARFLAHVTVLSTGEPVRSGTLRLEMTGPDGRVVTITAERPARDGLFIPVGALNTPGIHDGRIVLSSPQAQETIEFGTLTVYPNQKQALSAAEAEHDEAPADAVPFLLEQQWQIGLLMERATRRSMVKRLQVPGQIVAPSGSSAVISPPVAGRLHRAASGNLPRIGDRVQAGQILGFVEPPLPATEAAQLTANRGWIKTLEMELLMRELDLETKLLEVKQALPQANARLEFAQRTFDRLAKLREQGLGTEEQYDEAQRNLRLAQVQYEGAVALKNSYEGAAERLEEMRALTRSSELTSAAEGSIVQLPVIAPISGEIVAAEHIEGEYVEASDELFRIVNPDVVWIVAHVSEFDLGGIQQTPGAVMTLVADPSRRFDILGSSGGTLVNIGRVVDPNTRTIPITYEMPNPQEFFRIGMFVDLFLETQQSIDAVSIPESAIVMDSGRPTAYVLLNGERFQKRELALGIRDGGFVEITAGVEEGERVVTKGANAVKLAALSPASFGHGHAH